MYQRSLRIFESLHGSININSSSVIQNIGFLYFNRGEIQIAYAHFHAAIGMKTKINGLNHPDTAKCLANMAYFHMYSGELLLAEKLYQQARQVLLTSHGEESKIVKHIQTNLDLIELKQKQKQGLISIQ